MQAPLISVVIPTYNRAAYIADAIASVRAQTHTPVELIVVDDGSTDDTPELLQGLAGEGLRWLRQENRGFAAARNAGIAMASGALLAFLDSDDIWHADKLSRQITVFERAPDTDAVYGQAEQFVSPELNQAERARLRHMDGRVALSPTACSLLIRRAAFDRVGPFDESLRIGVDMDWYARLDEEQLTVVMLDEPVFRRRLHRSNLNLTHADEQPERLLVIKRALDRRRARARSEVCTDDQ